MSDDERPDEILALFLNPDGSPSEFVVGKDDSADPNIVFVRPDIWGVLAADEESAVALLFRALQETRTPVLENTHVQVHSGDDSQVEGTGIEVPEGSHLYFVQLSPYVE